MKIAFTLLTVGLVLLLSSCRINDIEHATAQTAGNDPTIKRGQTFSYSKSTTPKLFDLICFLGEVPTLHDKYLMTYRLCGMSGDTVQIKEGNFYLNSKLVDNRFSLKHNYYISKEEFERIRSSVPIDGNYSTDMAVDTLLIPMDDKFVINNTIKAKRQILSPTLQDSVIRGKFLRDWNLDNFGPVVVPKDTYFVLGDNRHNAWDSRYRGFIEIKDFLGTVLLEK